MENKIKATDSAKDSTKVKGSTKRMRRKYHVDRSTHVFEDSEHLMDEDYNAWAHMKNIMQ